jgi:hypothetical protein
MLPDQVGHTAFARHLFAETASSRQFSARLNPPTGTSVGHSSPAEKLGRPEKNTHFSDERVFDNVGPIRVPAQLL